MHVIQNETISDVYSQLIRDLLAKTECVGGTHEINNCCLVVEKPSISPFWLPYRKVSKKYLQAELEWYWKGSNSCKEIGQHAKMWLAITDDGETSNSAYGYILQKKYGFNQIEQVIELLKKDPASRRAVLNISDPAINRITTKDMQCTIALQFLVRDGKLHETVYMRSNDVYFGLPYDYVFFVTVGEYIASQLGLELGTYTHHATSMHMYLRDVEKFDERFDSDEITINTQDVVRAYYEK